MGTVLSRQLNRFALILSRLSGVVFAIVALACVASSLVSLYYADWGLAVFQALTGAAFSALAWLYLRGPLSRVGTGRSS